MLHVPMETLRDCEAWKVDGLPLSTTSNEAAKMLDAVIHQYVGWYDDSQLGGITGTFDKIFNTDPDFYLAKVTMLNLELIGTGRTVRLDVELANQISSILNCIEMHSDALNQWELRHAFAMKHWSRGQLPEACNEWELILIDHPKDILAAKFAHDTYFYLGQSKKMRNSIAKIIPEFERTHPFYGRMKGMLSFGLEETNLYSLAEKAAKEALEINKHDAWATHSLAHIFEMEGRQDEGISFMSRTLKDWQPANNLACHNTWHWALYHIEKNEHQAALDLFDNEIAPRLCKSGAMLDIVDGCSLLYRLQMEGVNVGRERFEEVYHICEPHLRDHVMLFNDLHFIFTGLGAGKIDDVTDQIRSIQDYADSDNSLNQWNAKISIELAEKLCSGLLSFNDMNYSSTVEYFQPITDEIIKIGGSHAQRDIFNQIYIRALINSDKSEHINLARCSLNERKVLRQNSPLTDRLINQFLEMHSRK